MRERLKGLIEPFDANKIEQAAYTLSVGREVYITPHGMHADPERNSKLQLRSEEGFSIPSGQFSFVLTKESVEIPDDAIGWISVRTPLKFQGLVNISGFHVDPGYKGQLIVSMFNAGPSPVTLAEGDGLLKIWYADLDGPTKDLKTGIHNQTISSTLISQVSGQLHSLQSLSREIDYLKWQQTSIKWTIGITATVIVVVFAAALAILTSIGSLNGHESNLNEGQPPALEQSNFAPTSRGSTITGEPSSPAKLKAVGEQTK
jgi:dCTP deaminase